VAEAGTVVEHKDVVLALLGASAGLSGLVLVFLGLVMAASDFAPGTNPKIVAAARRPAVAVLGSFAIGIACLTSTVIWLLLPRSGPYWVSVLLFFAQLGSLVVAATWVVRRTLWG
jgi:hypothetical protein